MCRISERKNSRKLQRSTLNVNACTVHASWASLRAIAATMDGLEIIVTHQRTMRRCKMLTRIRRRTLRMMGFTSRNRPQMSVRQDKLLRKLRRRVRAVKSHLTITTKNLIMMSAIRSNKVVAKCPNHGRSMMMMCGVTEHTRKHRSIMSIMSISISRVILRSKRTCRNKLVKRHKPRNNRSSPRIIRPLH